MNAFFAAGCGALFITGVMAIIVGWRRPPRLEPRRRRAPQLPRRSILFGSAWIVAGLGAGAVTGIGVLAVGVPLAAAVLRYLLSAPNHRELQVLEALDRWVRTLVALLPTGRSIADAVRVSARQAPPAIAAPLRLAVARLDDRWSTAQALTAMAADLDNPDADAVLAALTLSARRGGSGAGATLQALADTLQERLVAVREIDAERSRPRAVVRQVTAITVVLIGGALLLGGDFMRPYASGIGQVVLTALVSAYLGSLLLLRRLTLPRQRQRILREGR